MGRSEREKGSRAEREFINAIQDELGDYFGDVDKNWNQREEARFDLKLGPFAVEIKRQEKLALNTWWDEAVDQVKGTELMPMLAYRQSRQPWTIVLTFVDVAYLVMRGEEAIDISQVAGNRSVSNPPFAGYKPERIDWSNDRNFTFSMPLPAFAFLCREYIAPEVARGERSP